MYLKTLTIRGFKSFASATTFEFEPGVTAVVGPNGSGKSNVVDALAWVMGEQGAKTLRGGKMEDVIFAGTSDRQALGRAQVTLTIDNTDGALPIEYSEVTISRTLFRSGGSEYAINGSPCRLLDIQELLSDSGLGREMHVIVGQGQLDRVLRATPEDRRGFIEEAAGILKHRRRKEKTLRKLDATQANLQRLEDLTQEIGKQLKPLGKQAAAARRARTVQATVRDARSRLLADDLVGLEDQARTAREALAQLEELRRAAAQAQDGAAHEVARLEAEAARSAPETAAARTTWYELSRLQERFKALGSLAQERRSLLGSTEETAGGEDPDQLEVRAAQSALEAQQAEHGVTLAKHTLSLAGAERQEAERAQAQEDARLTALLRAVADRREGLARLAGQVGTARQRVESTEGERLRAAQNRDAARHRHAEAAQALGGAKQQAELAAAQAKEPTQRLAQAREELRTARAALAQAREAVGPLAERRAALQARVQVLGESLPGTEGAEDLLRPHTSRLAGVLGDKVTVRAGAEAAVQAALDGAERAVIAADARLPLDVADAAASGVAGSVRLVGPASGTNPRPWPPGLRRVTDLLTADADVAGIVDSLLGGIAWAQGEEEAARLAREHALVVVTMAGHRWDAHGVAIGAGNDTALLARRRALEEADAALEGARTAEATARELAAQRAPVVEAAQGSLAQCEQDARAASDASRAAGAEAQRLESLSLHSSQEAERSTLAEAKAAEQVGLAHAALAELADRLEAAQAVPEEQEPSTADRDRLAQAAADARAAEVEARLSLRAAEEGARRLRDRERSLLRAAQTERRAREEAKRRAAKRARRAARAQTVAHAVEQVLRALGSSVEEAERAVAAAEEGQRRRGVELETSRARLGAASAELARLLELAHADELAGADRQARWEHLAERALSELSMTPEHLVEHFGPHRPVPHEGDDADKWAALRQEVDQDGVPTGGIAFDRAEQEKRLKRAERDLSTLGRVNPLALEEFAALEERHSYLTSQLSDLRRSRADLLELVREVDEHVRVVFAEAFEDTAREFVKVFDRLFPGGEGRLRLTDPDDMLTTGIEVEARPAGKKVKRLSLLSGGERSLTAIALLVAIFTARPSPFYVMDEVEAALDERNLMRLLSVFSDLRERSQLIIITHQKHTMNIADALYGVSMRGDGVTKVISQRLDREGV